MLTYPQAIALLDSLIDRSHTHPTDRLTARTTAVQRTSELLTYLGNPQQSYPIIHVTGTKGKGSVSAMLASILQAAGYRVGLYTSPHLQDFRERFRIDGQLADSAILTAVVNEMQPYLEETQRLRWFEAVTALAFKYFQQQNVDVVIAEVGVGGRYDATNIVSPVLSVITSISYDHMHVLGTTLAEIAEEKAGIIKPFTPVVSAPQAVNVLSVLRDFANQKSASLHVVGHDSAFAATWTARSGQSVEVVRDGQRQTYTIALIGQHQAINVAVAVAAVHQLRVMQWHIDDPAVDVGLRHVQWPARFEVIDGTPLVVIDAAHNQDSMQWLAHTLKTIFPEQRVTVVLGAMADKDVLGMLQALKQSVVCFIFTQASTGRAMSPQQIQAIALDIGINPQQITLTESVGEALVAAKATSSDVVCVTGSLYVVGEARDLVHHNGVLMPVVSGQQAE